jgi:hypothetical protein
MTNRGGSALSEAAAYGIYIYGRGAAKNKSTDPPPYICYICDIPTYLPKLLLLNFRFSAFLGVSR